MLYIDDIVGFDVVELRVDDVLTADIELDDFGFALYLTDDANLGAVGPIAEAAGLREGFVDGQFLLANREITATGGVGNEAVGALYDIDLARDHVVVAVVLDVGG